MYGRNKLPTTGDYTMKVAESRPQVVKSVVRVTDEKYELYYANPKCLGTINKKGGYWYTADGMRFVSSRDALEYFIRLGEVATTQKLPESKPEVTTILRKQVAQKVVEKAREEKRSRTLATEFAEFLAWKKAQEDSRQLEAANGNTKEATSSN